MISEDVKYSKSRFERIFDGPIGATLRVILIIFLLYKAIYFAEIGKWTLMFLMGFWFTFELFTHTAWKGLGEIVKVQMAIIEDLDKQKSEIDQQLERLKNRD